jgi:hypothetical protein
MTAHAPLTQFQWRTNGAPTRVLTLPLAGSRLRLPLPRSGPARVNREPIAHEIETKMIAAPYGNDAVRPPPPVMRTPHGDEGLKFTRRATPP